MQEDEKQIEEQEYQSWMAKHQARMEEGAKEYKWEIKGAEDTTKGYTVKVDEASEINRGLFNKIKEVDKKYYSTSPSPREFIAMLKSPTRRTAATKLRVPSKSEETTNTSTLNELFSLVWETANNMGLPFEVLTNIDLYKKSIIDVDFISKFIHALNHNLVIVPLKIVNITNLNLSSPNFPSDVLDSAIRDKFGFRMFVSFFIPTLDSDQTNEYYDKDHVFLELNSTSPSYKAMKKEILDSFGELDVEMEQVGNTLDKLVKANPDYHKMVYDRNKSKISIDLLKTKIRDLDNKIYKLEKGVLSEDLLEKNDDSFKRAKTNLFNKLLEGSVKASPTKPSEKPGLTFRDYTTPWGTTILVASPSTSTGTESFVTTTSNDVEWTEPPITNSEQNKSFDFIDYPSNTYIDFEGDAHHIDTITELMLNTLFDADLMSEDSWNSLKQIKGYL